MRTNQELFDLAYRGLKAQGFERSYDRGCLYRDPNGRKCAIGHCIADEDYSRDYEHNNVINLPRKVRKAAGITKKNEAFASKLQNCHDEAATPYDMQSMLNELAREYNLTIPD